MKCWFLLVLLFLFQPLFGQKNLVPCNCEVLNSSEKNYFPSERHAGALLNQYIEALQDLSRVKKITDPIYIKEANCATPTSMICETELSDGRHKNIRLVLYNNVFLNSLTNKEKQFSLVDKHVLLHELGHHVLGHHKKISAWQDLRALYEKDNPDPGTWSKLGKDNPLAQELEADIYAVWALSKLDPTFTVGALVAQLNAETLKNMDDLSRREKGSSHPLFQDRIQTMKKFEIELKRTQRRRLTKNYFADVASSAYLDLWPESYVYDLALTLGSPIGSLTDFSSNGKKADSFIYPLSEMQNYQIGLSLSRFRWDRVIASEVDVEYSHLRYGTQLKGAGNAQLVESFEVNYLSFCPKLTYNSIGASGKSSMRSLRAGIFSSIGLNLRIPIGSMDYQNFTALVQEPSLRFSAGPKFTVGFALMKKSFLARGGKICFSYDPVWMRMNTGSKAHAVAHNFQFSVQYSIIRK